MTLRSVEILWRLCLLQLCSSLSSQKPPPLAHTADIFLWFPSASLAEPTPGTCFPLVRSFSLTCDVVAKSSEWLSCPSLALSSPLSIFIWRDFRNTFYWSLSQYQVLDSEVCSSMDFFMCIHPCKCLIDQDTEQFQQLKRLPCAFLSVISPVVTALQTLIPKITFICP